MEFNRLLQIRRIFAQPEALELPRGREIVERWPDADVVPVENHWNIPELHGDETNVPRWSRIKTEALVLGYGHVGDLELAAALDLVDRTVRALAAGAVRGIPGG